MKSIYQKDSCVSMFIEGLFPIVMIWNQPRFPSMNEWRKCERSRSIHPSIFHLPIYLSIYLQYTMEHYSTIKRSEILFAAKRMDLESSLSEIILCTNSNICVMSVIGWFNWLLFLLIWYIFSFCFACLVIFY
jgi:hypothetical protein